MRRFRRLAPAVGVALVTLAWAAPAATGQDGGNRLVLRGVDASDVEAIDLFLTWSGDEAAVDGAQVRENGAPVPAEPIDLADTGRTNDIAFVFDTSATTDTNNLLGVASRAAEDLFAALPPGSRAAVVTAGGGAQVLQRLTDDPAEFAEAIEDLTPAGDGALLAGVVRGANAVAGSGSFPTVVLFTDGVEGSTTSFDVATGALISSGAGLHVIGLQDGRLDEGAFARMAGESGGRVAFTGDAGDIDGLAEALLPELTPHVLRFSSEEAEGVLDLEVTVDGVAAEGSYISGAELIGARRVAPRPAVEPSGIPFFRSEAGRLIGVGAAMLAVVLFAYGVGLLFVRDNTLRSALQPYADGYGYGTAADDEGDGSGAAMAQTAFLQRAVAITSGFAERQGFLTRVERALEKADLPLRAGEALFFYLAGIVVVFVALLALTQNLLAALLIGAIGAIVPAAAVGFLARQKKKKFEALLPDTLQLLSSTLRAGYSMMQGVEAVSQEAADPMGKELRRVVTEARLGRPLEESLNAVAERMESADFGWAVMAIKIQREVGGNLAELLLTVAETMTERERLRRDVNALTAEGRMSAYVLLGLPIGLTFFLYSLNPDYIGLLFERTIGQVMLGAAAVAMVVGYAWMKKIITIEI